MQPRKWTYQTIPSKHEYVCMYGYTLSWDFFRLTVIIGKKNLVKSFHVNYGKKNSNKIKNCLEPLTFSLLLVLCYLLSWQWQVAPAHCQIHYLCPCPTCEMNEWNMGHFFTPTFLKKPSSAAKKPRGWQTVWVSLYTHDILRSFFAKATKVHEEH